MIKLGVGIPLRICESWWKHYWWFPAQRFGSTVKLHPQLPSQFPESVTASMWSIKRHFADMVFLVIMHECKRWTIEKAEHWRINVLELWCWRKLLRVPWTSRRSNQSVIKEINSEYSLEGLMIKLKLQYFGQLTHWKRLWCWERLKAGGEGHDRGWDG